MVYENGQFHQTNGTSITESSALPVEIASVNKVYDAETGKVKSWIWDIALSEAGHPVIAYAQYPSINDHIYHYAYWDGLKWIDQEIVNSGTHITKAEKSGKVLEEHYSGGIVLDHANPKNIYLSRQINGVFEIEHRQFKEGQWKIAAITSDSNSDNIRPYVVDSYTGKHPILLWMNGNYEHYTRYNTKILINEK